jgi:anti-anti-sigma factor
MANTPTTPAADGHPDACHRIEHPAPGLAIVRMRGEHDLSTAPRLTQALEQVAAHSNVIVDLSECDFIDSTVIARLLSTANDVRAEDEQLVVVIPPESKTVARVAHLIQLSELIPVHRSQSDAIASFERSHQRPSPNPPSS